MFLTDNQGRRPSNVILNTNLTCAILGDKVDPLLHGHALVLNLYDRCFYAFPRQRFSKYGHASDIDTLNRVFCDEIKLLNIDPVEIVSEISGFYTMFTSCIDMGDSAEEELTSDTQLCFSNVSPCCSLRSIVKTLEKQLKKQCFYALMNSAGTATIVSAETYRELRTKDDSLKFKILQENM